MRWITALICVVVTLATAACSAGAGTGAGTGAGVTVDGVAALRARVPAEYRQGAELTVGTDPTSEPMVYLDGGKPVGMDVDLGNAIAERLGLRLKWTPTSFGDLIDQTTEHRVDLLMTAMSDTAARQRRVDFLDYLYVGASIIVPKGTGDLGGLRGLCGRRVAVQVDTLYLEMVTAQQSRCPAGSRLRVVTVSGDPADEIPAGRADAALNDYPLAVAKVGHVPALEISGRQFEALPYGIGFAKDRRELLAAFQAALYSLIDDGTYDRLLEKWKLPEAALRTGAINGGV